jgi:alpha-D-xyloside xylohydrolase
MVYYNKLRYRLMPYIYTLAGMTWHNDYTIMRALAMDFPGDPMVTSVGDQYMFGPALMVAPIYQFQARSREVVFPAGTGWYDLYTGKYNDGGHTQTVAAPYEVLPLFVREGAILPFGPEIMHTAGNSADPITLYIYTGKNGAFNLYEDEGTNYDYEKGAYSIIPITWDEESGTLNIGERKGSWEGMPETRTFKVVWVSKEKPVKFDLSADPQASVTWSGAAVTVQRKS